MITLPVPARYFPLEKGVYEVAPGLRTLGTSLGNGEKDSLVFQLDQEFPAYRDNKLKCRAERLGKYYQTHDFSEAVNQAVICFMVERLAQEHSKFFEITLEPSGITQLLCHLTGEKLCFDKQWNPTQITGPSGSPAPYVSAYDALCSQVQEDMAVLCSNSERAEWLAAIHLCSPSHWAAEDKIGKNFFQIHAPVAGIEKMNRSAPSLVDAMINKGPYVRFVWGFATDRQLNHHPVPPPGVPMEKWRGRSFNAAATQSPFTLRVERQVIYGLPAVNASIFTVRVYFIDGNDIRANPTERAQLRSSLLSMTPEHRIYKGLDKSMNEIIDWLDGK